MRIAGRIRRRGFLKVLGACGLPWVVPGSAVGLEGDTPPSARITVGAIGFGGRGGSVFADMTRSPGVQGLAVCDVQERRRESAKSRGLVTYHDYRELLARTDLDAVVITTPSHWKPIHTIEAARAGKNVFCEKPASLTVRDGRAMVEAVRRYGRVFQHGTQQRSGREFRFACEMVRSGRIGQLKSATVYVGGPPQECSLPAQPVPAGIDWEMWLGPAPWRPFNAEICLRDCGGWERFRDYSGGGMTGWGSHHFDIAQWALAADETGPLEIIPPNGKDVRLLTYRYASGVLVYHANTMGTWAVLFEGTEGKIAVNRGKLQTWPEGLMEKPTGPDEVRLYSSAHHAGNFLQCIRTRERPICDAEIMQRTMTVCHLGNIAFWLRRPLKWDPAKEEFTGDAEANRLLDRPRRQPWSLS